MAAAIVLTLAQGAGASLTPQVSALTWQLQNPQNPPGSIGSDLSDVSCSSTTACTAVGSYESSGSVFTTFAERWNGSTWAIQNTPNATNSNLNGVTCLSATDCVAVGDVLTGTGIATATLVQVWNGSTWTTQSSPTPKNAYRAFLIGVDCTSPSQCTAVGSYSVESGGNYLLAERWNGTSWKTQTTPKPAGAKQVAFTGVSCGSASSCIAVGNETVPSDAMLAERWNGSSWTLLTVPNPSGSTGSGYLGGVSCTAAAACTAAGDYFNGSDQVTLAERWNGTTWTQQSTPSVIGANVTDLSGVSCASASACVTVGASTRHDRTRMKAEHWTSSVWYLASPPEPDASVEDALASVSCPTTTYCIAVGFWGNSSGTDFVLASQYS
jgi:hypothetical protein